ncbi:MATE family efflux transporter [Erysipelotrichaceae bacterium AM07-12]|uniref:MATE family efflux transporter n=1 Tax=Longicatena caecimuris TaxID=1796635 RepID=UPI000E4092D3|nr:MATE family efflux transporter [Longicatena caecimuris]RGD43137.1 MATE family efflux transporter [Erysipelotrichaceae bacterium AM07-12]RGD45744.1 MATE family efflux transporter [Erysipelotrichaceae bacterium AM07-35-1]
MQQEKTKQKGLMTEGVIWKELLLFSVPLLLGNLFQQLYNAVDSVVVGNYIGAQALAAVGSSAPVINLLVSFFMGLSVGAGVIISRYFGARNMESLQDSIHTSLALTMTAGIFMTLFGIIFSPTILRWIGTPMDVMGSSVLYLRIYFGGILSVMLYNMGSGILRAVGDSKNPLYFLIVSSITNILLDLLFVIVFDMGIAGVGWATLIAQTISAVLTLLLLIKTKQEYKVTLKKIRFHKDKLIEIIRLGLPSGIQNGVVSFSNVIVQSNINAFGSLAMAGCGAYTKIDGFAILPVMSYSMALTTFTGQNMGAKKYDRVKQGARSGIIMSLLTTIAISALLLIFGEQVLSIFSDNPKVISYGLYMMHVLAPFYIFLAISHAFNGIIRGAGITTIPMIVMITCWCGMRMTWILASVPIFHDIGVVFMGWPLTWAASALWLFLYYKKGNWMKRSMY